MKKLISRPEVNLNGQKSEVDKNDFSIKDILTKDELAKIKGGGGDIDPDPIIIGGPK